jgi:F-type H+-transporting ATPase subunit b
MQLDWFTLIAQIVNFLILVFLLQHFLYTPIVRAMDQREQKIATRLEEAQKKRDEADEQFEKYRERLRSLEQERDERLQQIEEEVEEKRRNMLDQTHSEIERLKREWKKDLEREHKSFLQSIRATLGQEFGEVMRQLMIELADANFENQMIGVFYERLNDVDEDQKDQLQQSLDHANGNIIIRSAFEISDENKRTLAQTIHNNLFPDRKFDTHFETTDDLIAGVELEVGGRRLIWSVEDYLDTLQERIQQALQEEFEKENQAG